MLIIMGHDEAIIKQYLLTNKHWTGPNGEKAISPKDGPWNNDQCFSVSQIWLWNENYG
jgi:hypothetical protein